MLSDEMKAERVPFSREHLERFEKKKWGFLKEDRYRWWNL